MFEYLKEYNHILVTGTPRSGTRICSTMIADDTGYPLIEEQIFDRTAKIYIDLCYRLKFSVVQYPLAFNDSFLVNELKKLNGLVIIFMKRDTEDIIASWKRLLDIRNRSINNSNNNYRCGSKKQIDNIEKNRYYDEQLLNFFTIIEVNYDSLSAHPLYVDKEDRKKFKIFQTEKNQVNRHEKIVIVDGHNKIEFTGIEYEDIIKNKQPIIPVIPKSFT